MIIKQLHAELVPLVDRFQEAGTRGVYNLNRLPYRGIHWEHRAFQRDPFVVAFTNVLPSTFGTFARRDDLISQRRLMFHSEALNVDLVLRRRGSFGAFKQPSSASAAPRPIQEKLFECQPQATTDTRLAALIWDVPPLDEKHHAVGPTPIVVKLSKPGRQLDENAWESGFRMLPVGGDHLIPDRTEYRHDIDDWDVESETAAQ